MHPWKHIDQTLTILYFVAESKTKKKKGEKPAL